MKTGDRVPKVVAEGDEKRCPLCRSPNPDPQLSHLMPKGLYKVARNHGAKNPNPYAVSPDRVVQTSRQIRKSLLCLDCERLLNERGERYTLQQCFRAIGNFPLQERLRKIDSVRELEPGTKLFAGSAMLDLDVESIVHCGVGILWKSGATYWRVGKRRIYNPLGPYAEALRLFLLGDGPFPELVSLMFSVSSAEFPLPIMLFPCWYKVNMHYVHRFIFSGLEYRFYVGSDVLTGVRAACFYKSTAHPIVVSQLFEEMAKRDIRRDLGAGYDLDSGFVKRSS